MRQDVVEQPLVGADGDTQGILRSRRRHDALEEAHLAGRTRYERLAQLAQAWGRSADRQDRTVERRRSRETALLALDLPIIAGSGRLEPRIAEPALQIRRTVRGDLDQGDEFVGVAFQLSVELGRYMLSEHLGQDEAAHSDPHGYPDHGTQQQTNAKTAPEPPHPYPIL